MAPFRYHSVRSLGFLLYSICHLQNRLNCKFDESTFEQLMQYFRITNPIDAERAWKVDLTDKKALPDGLQFVKRDERWEVDAELVQMALQKNRQIMADNSASFTQDFDQETGPRRNRHPDNGQDQHQRRPRQRHVEPGIQLPEIPVRRNLPPILHPQQPGP